MGLVGKVPLPVALRMEEKIAPEPNTGCWLWLGTTNEHGYGCLRVGSMRDGTRRQAMAHRTMWELRRGPIPVGMFVCHKCDTPPCVNPDHLFLGTLQDNHADMMAKGRGSKPPRNANNGWWWKQKTHCKSGHEFTPDNTYVFRGVRHCKKCNRVAQQKMKERKQKWSQQHP